MANIKSAIKRIRSSKRRAVRNRTVRTHARTAIKSARELIETDTDQTAVAKSINAASSALDAAASKGILHKRNASRRKSRLMKAAAKAKAAK